MQKDNDYYLNYSFYKKKNSHGWIFMDYRNNIDALETIVNYAMDKDIPYLAINIPNDTCLECGYTGEFNNACPMCGSTNIQQLRRVTGYLTGDYKTAFNKGKQQETEMRYKHTKSLDSDIWKRD